LGSEAESTRNSLSSAGKRALAQLVVETLPELLHDGEDGFSGAPGLGNQYGQRASGGDRLQEEPARDPGGDAHLAGLQDDVAGGAVLFEGTLRGVGGERTFEAETVTDAEQHPGEEEERWAVVAGDRRVVENLAHLQQALDVADLRSLAGHL
jgi:hypothetical protein